MPLSDETGLFLHCRRSWLIAPGLVGGTAAFVCRAKKTQADCCASGGRHPQFGKGLQKTAIARREENRQETPAVLRAHRRQACWGVKRNRSRLVAFGDNHLFIVGLFIRGLFIFGGRGYDGVALDLCKLLLSAGG